MFPLIKFTFCSILLCLVLTIKISPLAQDVEEEGTVDSDNPKIDGEENEIDDPDAMFSEDLDDGDILLTDTQKREFADPILARALSNSKKYKWPKTVHGKQVIIPYIITAASGYSK